MRVRNLLIIMVIIGILTNYLMVRFHMPQYLASLFAPMELGVACSRKSFQEDISLVFENIGLVDALNLIAGFSCNRTNTSGIANSQISTNFTVENWVLVAKELCIKNSLYCSAENGVFIAVPISSPIVFGEKNDPGSR